jgi:hypothetical protein
MLWDPQLSTYILQEEMVFIVANLQITEGNKQQSEEYSLKVFRKKKTSIYSSMFVTYLH